MPATTKSRSIVERTATTPHRTNTKRRKMGPIHSLPAHALRKLHRLCQSDTPYREIANWLRESFGFHVTEQIVCNWWKWQQRAQQPSNSSDGDAFAIEFKIIVPALGARGFSIQISTAATRAR